jgi:hypothetical protein
MIELVIQLGIVLGMSLKCCYECLDRDYYLFFLDYSNIAEIGYSFQIIFKLIEMNFKIINMIIINLL